MTEKLQVLRSIELPAELRSLPGFMTEISKCARLAGFDEGKVAAIELALEEVIVNVVKYSRTVPEDMIVVTCRTDGADRLYIEVIDSGLPFDPLTKGVPDTNSGIEDRTVGGLGIFLMKNMTDDVSYRREDGKNILTMQVKK